MTKNQPPCDQHPPLIVAGTSQAWTATCRVCVTTYRHDDPTVPDDVRAFASAQFESIRRIQAQQARLDTPPHS